MKKNILLTKKKYFIDEKKISKKKNDVEVDNFFKEMITYVG